MLIVGTVWIVQFRGTATLRTAEGPIFGTYYHIKYEASEPLDSVILAELKKVDTSLSVFNQLSTLSAINAGKSERTDAMLYEVLTKARHISSHARVPSMSRLCPWSMPGDLASKKVSFPPMPKSIRYGSS